MISIWGGEFESNTLNIGNDTLFNIGSPLTDVFLVKYSVMNIHIPQTTAPRCDTVSIPVNIGLGTVTTASSIEFTISGYKPDIEFIGLDTVNTLYGQYGWTYSVNETDTNLIVAAAGANEISNEGILVYLKFFIPFDSLGYIPLNIDTALIDEYDFEIATLSGSITIEEETACYGDASLNGDIRAYDASLTLKYLVDMIEFNCKQLENADVTEDNSISALDAAYTLQYVSGVLDSLPYVDMKKSGELSPFIEMQDIMVRPGENIIIPVKIFNANGLMGIYLEFEYTSKHLKFSGIDYAENMDDFINLYNENNGTIKLAAAGSKPIHSNTTTIYLKFKINDFTQGESFVSLVKSRINENTPSITRETAIIKTLTNIDNNYDDTGILLEQNKPNPFSTKTEICFTIPENNHVTLKVYNLNGELIKSIVDQHLIKGSYTYAWNVKNKDDDKIMSGYYVYELTVGKKKIVKKMLAQ